MRKYTHLNNIIVIKLIIFPDLKLVEMTEKVSAAEAELAKEQLKVRQSNRILTNVRNDLHKASGILQEPAKLRNCIRVIILYVHIYPYGLHFIIFYYLINEN